MPGQSVNNSYARLREVYRLPVSRVKTIMKSSPDVENIQQASIFLVSKATEMFIQYLAKQGLEKCKGAKEIDYNCLAEVVQSQESLSFLQEIMPRKIKFGQYKAMMAARGRPIPETRPLSVNEGEDDDDDDDDDDGDGESDDK